MAKQIQIVIAWAEQTKLVPTGRTVVRDLNYFPEFRADWEGRSCMWLNNGTEADLARAQDWAATEGKAAYAFPTSETNALGLARELAVQQTQAA